MVLPTPDTETEMSVEPSEPAVKPAAALLEVQSQQSVTELVGPSSDGDA